MGKSWGRRAYFVDPQLLPRVQEYADEQLDGTNLTSEDGLRFALRDADAIAAYLIRKYPRHYGRKNRQVLARSVAKAVQVIISRHGKGAGGAPSADEEEREDNEDGSETEGDGEGDGDEEGDGAGTGTETGGDLSATEETQPPPPPPAKPTNMLNQALTRQYATTGGGPAPEATPATQQPASGPIPHPQPSGSVSEAGPGAAPAETAGESAEARQGKRKRTASMTGSARRQAKRLREEVDADFNGKAGKGVRGATERPALRYSDLGGIEHCLQDVRELIEYPLTHPEIYTHLGVEPPRGILLHGPPGTGKTMLANAIAGELGLPFLKISAPEIVSGMSGESEAKIRELFDQAMDQAPCIVFIDEIDAITPKRESAQREMERRIVAQLLTSLDDLTGRPVVVIGATNRPEALDPALRRAGRFDREISLGIPDKDARTRILRVMCGKLRLAGEIDLDELGQRTPGYVGADLVALTREAAVIAVNRIFKTLFEQQALAPPAAPAVVDLSPSGDPLVTRSDVISVDLMDETPALQQATTSSTLNGIEARQAASEALRSHGGPLTAEQLEPLSITMADFEEALGKVQPSSKREGFATIPDVTWADVGALVDVRDELQMAILEPIRAPEKFAAVGLTTPSGVLLYGPPGCGKTLLAKAIANESGASFISVKGPELLNKYVGESEKSIRLVFQRARDSAPCVMFFDELDALCPRRGTESHASERVVNQLLTEMDGLESRKQVFVIGATNRPDIIDPAMLRPGRLDKLLYVDLPSPEDRHSILRTLTRKAPLAADVDIGAVARDPLCTDFSGADLAALVKEATLGALRESLATDEMPIVTRDHFKLAFTKVQPSVSAKDRRVYADLKNKLRKARAHLTEGDGAAPPPPAAAQ